MKTELEQAHETIDELKLKLYEANCIIEAIKDGAIDALVVNKAGMPSIYTLESADFTYRMLIEKSGEGALSISPSGLILYCNECFADMVGAPPGKIIGTYFNSYVDSVGKFQELKLALQHGPSKGEIVLNVDGRKLVVYASLSDLGPQVSAIGIIITDLTEKRMHEDALTEYREKLESRINELKRTNFNLEQFIHLIRNDIKEPLRKISVYVGALADNKKQHFDSDEMKRLKMVHGAATRISTMLNDVSRYALNVHQADTSEVDLNSVLKEVADDMALLIEERNVELNLKTLPLIKGSPVQMHLLFLNLFDNVIRFSPENTPLTLKITADIEDCVDMRQPNKKYHRIDMHDGGSSIGAMQLDRDAVPWRMNDKNPQSEKNQLSLAICQRIMENHAGKIEVYSSAEAPSGFRLYFPLP